MATLDGSTREEHAELDGQIVPIDEPFGIDGYFAMYPGDFGEPEMDYNCRCTIVEKLNKDVADKQLDRMQERAD